ncbi:sensor histidine kinase [Taibaiella koreensis]|uniref:sensor histidine kinase n=1 Tax=Taibaiella koreensis TaxID=1268548 RepID=UPI000E59ECAB|nr:histidine kinase [Taibaiella koreensis]
MTAITVSGRPLNPLQQNLVLKHKDNNISFEYSGISFLSEGDITYRYRIKGLDDHWKTTRESVLTYPSLPSGVYTLELVAINKFRDESKVLQYHFKIEKSILETAWFRMIAALITVLSIVLVVRYTIRLSHRKETNRIKIDYKIKSLEQMALRAQMNPHFIFNCLNSMQQYILVGDVKKANFYLSKFSELVRETLNNASRIYISLEEELSYLTKYIDLERLQLSNTFDYEIEVDPELDQKKIMVPNMVLQPYVENAIKHGLSRVTAHGRLRVRFGLLREQQILECIVEDNGPGIEHVSSNSKSPLRKDRSKGMSITGKRIDTLNELSSQVAPIKLRVRDISNEHTGATGTRISIDFPF